MTISLARRVGELMKNCFQVEVGYMAKYKTDYNKLLESKGLRILKNFQILAPDETDIKSRNVAESK